MQATDLINTIDDLETEGGAQLITTDPRRKLEDIIFLQISEIASKLRDLEESRSSLTDQRNFGLVTLDEKMKEHEEQKRTWRFKEKSINMEHQKLIGAMKRAFHAKIDGVLQVATLIRSQLRQVKLQVQTMRLMVSLKTDTTQGFLPASPPLLPPASEDLDILEPQNLETWN